MELHRLAACAGCGRQFDVSAGGELAGLGGGDRFRCSCGGEVTVPSARPETASVVACSACGGPRQGEAVACRWCGADFTLHELELDAICPRCAARVRRRGAFCHHCALPLTAPDEAVPTDYRCPSCAAAGRDGAAAGEDRLLVSRRVGEGDPLHLFECRRCAGMWLDRDVFHSLVERARQGRSGLPAASRHGAGPPPTEGWSYRPCPLCSGLMNRRNYGRRSGILLDVCLRHGVWFDHQELPQVLEWVRRGGASESELPPAAPPRPAPVAEWGGGVESAWGRSGDFGGLLAGLAAVLGRALFERR
jgi:Zn-finger nucleic acid-binding protein